MKYDIFQIQVVLFRVLAGRPAWPARDIPCRVQLIKNFQIPCGKQAYPPTWHQCNRFDSFFVEVEITKPRTLLRNVLFFILFFSLSKSVCTLTTRIKIRRGFSLCRTIRIYTYLIMMFLFQRSYNKGLKILTMLKFTASLLSLNGNF